MRIRPARDDDLDAVLAIRNQAVETSTALWTTARLDRGDGERWLAAHRRAQLPVLVPVDANDAAIGYASLSPWRSADGYRYSAEDSIYIADGHRGAGIGRRLLEALLAAGREIGVHTVVAAIEAGNTASIRLHERAGFERAGLVREAGTKFGAWLDLTVLQIVLDDTAPDDPVPVRTAIV
jgi:phosphinothricin acetyltransferase